MLPEVKVYKIDYEFLIKNYLDVNLWQQVWTLLVYKEHVFTLNMCSIDTKNFSIKFEVRKNNINSSQFVDYSIRNTPVNILINQINGAIFRLMEMYDEYYCIKQTDIYQDICDANYDEKQILGDLARDYLTDNGVTNTNIVDAYIDDFVERNNTLGYCSNSYVSACKYSMNEDMFITFCKITDDKTRLNTVLATLRAKDERVSKILKTVSTFIEEKETEKYMDNLYNMLEAI